jgi:pimeloyl-ACP methyl ester carboxylesterase
MEGQTFGLLAAALASAWRVIALDQRGHGYSGHASTYTRQDYLGDLDVLFAHLGISRAVLLGNSLGGVNAYQFAARHPDYVRALIVEDIGALIAYDTSFALSWSGVFKTCQDLEERIGPRFFPYLKDSVRSVAGGWRLAFEPQDTVQSQTYLNGDHWVDWLASICPALLIRGEDSRVTTQEHVEEMTERRPNTRLRVLPGGHVVHRTTRGNKAVLGFLNNPA